MSGSNAKDGETRERPDTTEDVRQVDEAIKKLEGVAASYRDKDDGYVHLIALCTLLATLIAVFNMWFKANLEQLGGWIPFCMATAALSGLATYYASMLKREEPKAHKERCLKYRHKLDEVRRKLCNKKLAPTIYGRLQKEFVTVKGDAADYLLPGRQGKTKLWGYFWVVLFLGSYFGWSAWVLAHR